MNEDQSSDIRQKDPIFYKIGIPDPERRDTIVQSRGSVVREIFHDKFSDWGSNLTAQKSRQRLAATRIMSPEFELLSDI
jgi:hypothetical protein